MSQSSCLYDEDEESWPVKLHLGCGGIYLADSGTGYTNIDAEGQYANLNPLETEQNKTTIIDYYARMEGSPDNLPKRRPNIVDCIADIVTMEYMPNSVDKIVAIQTLEHISPGRLFVALRHWHTMLKTLHPMVVSIPEMYGTLEMINTHPQFAFRHLTGRRGDYLNTHHAWYTEETFLELLNLFGFNCEILENFHFYPAIVVRAIKR